jgi:hypothetical protein
LVVFAVLGLELMASHLLSRSWTIYVTPPTYGLLLNTHRTWLNIKGYASIPGAKVNLTASIFVLLAARWLHLPFCKTDFLHIPCIREKCKYGNLQEKQDVRLQEEKCCL